MPPSNPISCYSSLLLTIYRQAQELPVDQFQDGILEALKRHLPFDTSLWGTATMTEGGVDIHSLHLHNTTPTMVEAYDRVKHLDVAAHRVAQQTTATVGFNSDTDFEGPELAPLREFLHAFRHRNFFITSNIHPVTRFGQWVSLYRHRAEQVCTREEIEMLSCIGPHLMQALAINRLVHLDRLTGDTAREKWSVAIADGRGVLYHADPRFRELMDAEWPGAQADRLPVELLAQLRGGERQVAGRAVIVRRSLERGLLFLKARGREAVDSLTAREFLVGRLLASGLSHKQVAAQLDRSPETVRSQVKSIFAKLGIRNAALLAPLLALRE